MRRNLYQKIANIFTVFSPFYCFFPRSKPQDAIRLKTEEFLLLFEQKIRRKTKVLPPQYSSVYENEALQTTFNGYILLANYLTFLFRVFANRIIDGKVGRIPCNCIFDSSCANCCFQIIWFSEWETL